MSALAATKPPRTVETERLVLSHFSLERHHPLDDRIQAAASAGFVGIGLFAGQYRQLLSDGWSAARVHELLDENDIAIAQVEVLSGWGARQPSDDYLDFERFVWEMVDEFGVPYVQAIGPVDDTFVDAAVRFAALCDRAAEHNATVGLEFLPFTNVADATDALAIVEGAGRPNGGVCVDIWHHVRGANDLDLIRRIPAEMIAGVQMNDGPMSPRLADYKEDCLRTRVPPGEGTFEVDAFVTALLDLGVDLSWDLEVCNDNAWGPSGAGHVAACADGMRDVLRRCLSDQTTPTNHIHTERSET
jgi:sugar phosphate isomerase/epimerase